MKRRNFLKLLGLSSLAALTPLPFGSLVNEPRPHPRGQLWLLLGKRRIGKTTLGRMIVEDKGSRSWWLFDDCDRMTDGLADCKTLLNNGVNVVATVSLSKSPLAVHDSISMEVPSTQVSLLVKSLMVQADVVLVLTGYGTHSSPETGVVQNWPCHVLKDRRDYSPYRVYYKHSANSKLTSFEYAIRRHG